tara:strand:+ start:948 stop:1226 length:279 start_codon:yes stop_codon:yes gene_type:complete
MKTFKDVTFKQHKLGKGHIQGLLMLDNGIELSIVAGSGMYSTSKNGPRSAVNNVKDVASFEVAIINKDGEFVDDVLGWQGREDIDKLIKKHS